MSVFCECGVLIIVTRLLKQNSCDKKIVSTFLCGEDEHLSASFQSYFNLEAFQDITNTQFSKVLYTHTKKKYQIKRENCTNKEAQSSNS